MQNHVTGQAAASTAAPTLHHGTYRRAIMAAMSAECFTPAERLRANHSVYECENGPKLTLWLKNVGRVAKEREAQAQAQALTNMAHGIERFEATLPSAPSAPTAMQRTQACQDVATLQKWYRNTVREIARREEAAGMEATELVAYATTAQKEEIIRLANSTYILRKEKTAAHLKLPRLDYAGAVALIGDLWAKILRRQARAAEGMESASDSFYNAA